MPNQTTSQQMTNNNMDGVPEGLQQTGRGEANGATKVSFLRTILGRGMFKGASRSKEEVEMQKRSIGAVPNNGPSNVPGEQQINR